MLVPIRDKQLNVLPDVLVEEMGYKMGLNGVDNAKLSFDNVRGDSLYGVNCPTTPRHHTIKETRPCS